MYNIKKVLAEELYQIIYEREINIDLFFSPLYCCSNDQQLYE